MHVDVADLRAFYATPLGTVVRRVLSQHIRSHWRSTRGDTVIGLGYAAPYLGAFRCEARRVGAFMPCLQGAAVWPAKGPCLGVLVEEERLPLADNAVDKLLAVHCLEAAERVGPLLREAWRVLSPEGRLLLVVPNRRGVWARLDTTPFGQGRPYSRGQIGALLGDAMFTPLAWTGALHLPPVNHHLVVRSAATIERAGARLTPAFAGVIIVEAKKELMAPVGKTARARVIGTLALEPGSG
jgi:SAM-dependent methyltransferase